MWKWAPVGSLTAIELLQKLERCLEDVPTKSMSASIVAACARLMYRPKFLSKNYPTVYAVDGFDLPPHILPGCSKPQAGAAAGQEPAGAFRARGRGGPSAAAGGKLPPEQRNGSPSLLRSFWPAEEKTSATAAAADRRDPGAREDPQSAGSQRRRATRHTHMQRVF